MEFHGKNFMKKNPSYVYEKFYDFSMKFHGIAWNFMKLGLMEFHGIPRKIPWISMEFREFMEFHEIRFRQGCYLSVSHKLIGNSRIAISIKFFKQE
jgi:hypothetical protein